MKICVVGAGIAGSVAAFWLAKAGFKVIVIEKTPSLAVSGQGIDIAGPARDVLRRMGLEQKVIAQTTKEKGMAFVDQNNQVWGVFDAGDEKTDIGFTKEIEIIRGDLAKIFYEAAAEFSNVDFRFNTTIESLTQTDDKAIIKFSGSDNKEDFDIVIGADGLGSQTRKFMITQQQNEECYKPVGATACFFSIPRQDQDWPRSRWFNIPGGKTLTIRPRNQNISSAYLITVSDNPKLQAAAKSDVTTQKALMEKTFRGSGWESDRVIADMKDSDDFYFSPIAQVKIKGPWSKGRYVLVGDAACCPSPITGFGTTAAIVGSYVLAGELSEKHQDPSAALKSYEDVIRPYLEEGQKIPFGGRIVNMMNPQTVLGTFVLRWLTWLVSWSGIFRWFSGFEPAPFDLPHYKTLTDR